jgi:endonuclease III
MMRKIDAVQAILLKHYGSPKKIHYDPVETLILTILSQNTNDINRDKAYTNLRKAFPTWDSVLIAQLPKIEKAIRLGGLAKGKARTIKSALEKIKFDRGKYSLDFLEHTSLEKAREYLLSIKGVGPKTAAVVLCFALNKPAFPVDTHIFRVSKRLGLIPEGTTVERAHILLEKQLVPEQMYSFHLNLIQHGREVCIARKPKCPVCFLRRDCSYKFKTQP